jgi:hypothetical protein
MSSDKLLKDTSQGRLYMVFTPEDFLKMEVPDPENQTIRFLQSLIRKRLGII